MPELGGSALSSRPPNRFQLERNAGSLLQAECPCVGAGSSWCLQLVVGRETEAEEGVHCGRFALHAGPLYPVTLQFAVVPPPILDVLPGILKMGSVSHLCDLRQDAQSFHASVILCKMWPKHTDPARAHSCFFPPADLALCLQRVCQAQILAGRLRQAGCLLSASGS